MMAWRNYSGNKYNSKKIEVDGMTFDSKKEYRRFQELKLLESSGAISNLKRQVKFVLIPAQYERITKYNKKKKELVEKKGKCLERECSYIADFFYWDVENEKEVVEDVKGYKNPSSSGYAYFALKRKLMLYVHGIRITEI